MYQEGNYGTAKPVQGGSVSGRSRKRRSQAIVYVSIIIIYAPHVCFLSIASTPVDSFDSLQLTHSTCFSPKKLFELLLALDNHDTKE